jgi:hypothetical protein
MKALWILFNVSCHCLVSALFRMHVVHTGRLGPACGTLQGLGLAQEKERHPLYVS